MESKAGFEESKSRGITKLEAGEGSQPNYVVVIVTDPERRTVGVVDLGEDRTSLISGGGGMLAQGMPKDEVAKRELQHETGMSDIKAKMESLGDYSDGKNVYSLYEAIVNRDVNFQPKKRYGTGVVRTDVLPMQRVEREKVKNLAFDHGLFLTEWEHINNFK